MSRDGPATGTWLKFAALVAFVTTMVAVVHFAGGIEVLEYDRVQAQLAAAGAWAPLIYVAVYALATLATVPGTVLTVLGAALFPLGWAYLLVLIGATLGACLSFVVARVLGRDAVEQSLARATGGFAEKVREWTGRVERNGIFAIAYLRLAYVPFPLLNYAAPLTGVSLRDFTIGTLLGIIPGAFVFVFMGNTLRDAWETGSVAGLQPWQVAASVVLFGVSLSIPIVLQRRFGPPRKG